ncbi:hypothetical protein C8R43DRAFT_944172 [Mycena crocata]|nr:hypothetical protein C8R43DRAFT_944172 [Mycena crocata]
MTLTSTTNSLNKETFIWEQEISDLNSQKLHPHRDNDPQVQQLTATVATPPHEYTILHIGPLHGWSDDEVQWCITILQVYLHLRANTVLGQGQELVIVDRHTGHPRELVMSTPPKVHITRMRKTICTKVLWWEQLLRKTRARPHKATSTSNLANF